MDWYLAVLQKYAEFNGRARRKEYWMFVLVNLVVSFVVGFVCGLLHVPALSWLYSLAVLVPSIAVGVRRLHDTGRSGWWLLIALVPILGSIALIVFLAQDSQAGDNEFGANPKGGEPAYA